MNDSCLVRFEWFNNVKSRLNYINLFKIKALVMEKQNAAEDLSMTATMGDAEQKDFVVHKENSSGLMSTEEFPEHPYIAKIKNLESSCGWIIPERPLNLRQLVKNAQQVYKDRTYSFNLGFIDGVEVKGVCRFVKTSEREVFINPNFFGLENHSIQWLHDMNIVPDPTNTHHLSQDILQKVQNQVAKMKKTNIVLLAAATLPKVGKEALKIASDVNAWLFINDDLLDARNSDISRNKKLVYEIFDEYLKALKGEEYTLPGALSDNKAPIILGLLAGLHNVGERLRAIVDPSLIKYVYEGFLKYKKGCVTEAGTRKKQEDLAEGKSSVDLQISLSLLNSTRHQAGAVDFVFEIAFALQNISLTQKEREILEDNHLARLGKDHICYFNDVLSGSKEKSEGLNENLVLHYMEINPALTFKTAVDAVMKEVNTCATEFQTKKQEVIVSLKESGEEREKPIDMAPISTAIESIENWMEGHVIWEVLSVEGRHPKLLDTFLNMPG
ncbi:MAG: terpene synthase family protein [Methylomicrobium sp.]